MCLNPQKAGLYEYTDRETGEIKRKLFFGVGKARCASLRRVYVPCGHCVECAMSDSNKWAVRILDEASLYTSSCFVTLTYAHDPVTISKEHVQVFIRELRRRLAPLRIRYFASGEYGSQHARPHYHIAIFGYSFPDKYSFQLDRRHNLIYRSPFLESLWPYGFSSIGTLDEHSAIYVAKYLQKVQELPEGLEPPFCLMSTRPGIGYGAIDWRSPETMYIYRNGNKYPIPRYYLKKLKEGGVSVHEAETLRQKMAETSLKTQDVIENARLRYEDLFGTWKCQGGKKKKNAT